MSGGSGGEDLYGDEDAHPMKGEDESDAGDGKEHSDAEEAILPKSILAGKHFDVGDEVVLKITAMHDDRISVQYAPSKPDEDEGEEGGKAEMPESISGGEGGGGDSMFD